ncbi:MAG: translation initiation factor IF-3 [Patescibacteria group bacterium]|nr:translation initiation factor IF-3 [Patescibacteria group bacterium]
MRRTWRKAKPKPQKRFRVNQQITSPEVFLIGENGEKIGKISTREALIKAETAELDLVEVNPGKLPVAKIMDYGQFKYDKEKKAHKQKVAQKKVETKGVRLSVRISKHDFTFRIEQATKFLQKKHKLKIELILKGRERQHPEKAAETIKKFIAELNNNDTLNIVPEQDLTKQGGRFTIILVNKNE